MVVYFSPQWVAHLKEPCGLLRAEAPDFEADGVGLMEGPRLKTHVCVWVRLDGDRIVDCAWQLRQLPEAAVGASGSCPAQGRGRHRERCGGPDHR